MTRVLPANSPHQGNSNPGCEGVFSVENQASVAVSEARFINRDELARALRCSLPTVSALLKRYPDFPVVERGGLGRAWRFDLPAVIGFLTARREEEAAIASERSELLAQFTLPIGRQDESGQMISIDEEIKLAKLRALQRDELKEAGFLVQTHEVRQALERALRRFGTALDSAIDRVARQHNLPEPVKRAIEREFADARAGFVRDAADFIADERSEDELFNHVA